MSCGTPGFPAPCPASGIDLSPMQQAVVDGGAALIAALIAIGGTLVLIQLVAMAVRWVSGEVGGSPPITPTSSMPMVSDGNGTKPASDTATSTDQVSEFSPRGRRTGRQPTGE